MKKRAFKKLLKRIRLDRPKRKDGWVCELAEVLAKYGLHIR